MADPIGSWWLCFQFENVRCLHCMPALQFCRLSLTVMCQPSKEIIGWWREFVILGPLCANNCPTRSSSLAGTIQMSSPRPPQRVHQKLLRTRWAVACLLTFFNHLACGSILYWFLALFITTCHHKNKKMAQISVASDSVFMLFFLHPFRVALEKLHQPPDNVARTWTPTAGANERKNSWQMTTTTRQPLVIEIQAMKVRSSINFSISPLLFSHVILVILGWSVISYVGGVQRCFSQAAAAFGEANLIHVFIDLCLFSLPFSEGTNPS